MKHLEKLMALALCTLLFVVAIGRLSAEEMGFNEAVERAAVNRVLVQYTTGLDTLNEDLYADSFAADARFIIGETVNEGHADIRKIITDLQDTRKERAEQAEAEGKEYLPPMMHHVMSNAFIEFVDETTATHHAYWMTITGNDRDFNVVSMGRYEDTLKKINGKWKISERNLLR